MAEKIKILIVDDDPKALESLSDIFEEKGYQICMAPDGETALETVEKVRPDIVLLDTLLPGIDGHEVCRRIKGMKGFDIKVIVTTGSIDAVDAVKARESGADDYVVKTSAFEQLLNAVEKLGGSNGSK